VTCADVGFPADTQFGSDDSSGKTGSGFTVTSDGQNLSVSAVPDNTTIDVLIVKGGDAYNVYPSGTFTSLPAIGLHAPLVGTVQNVGTISHWFLCYGPTPEQEITPPSATSTGDCDGADVTLNAGTLATVFTLTRAGDLAGQTYPLAAGASQVVPVSLDATHSTVVATAGGPALTTFLRDNAVCDANTGGGGDDGNGGGDNGNGGGGDNNGGGDSNDGGGGNTGGGSAGNGAGGSSGGAAVTNPAVSSADACKSGITVSLSNLGATAPVIFTLTAPDGSISQVTVGADQSATRTFAVAEDSTGTVIVAAPGLATRTVSYHKDCVTVLGVKHVRHHTHKSTQGERTQVLGNQASKAQLPFTGFDSRGTAIDGALAIGLGLGLCIAGGRRRRPEHGRRPRG
jgi:hypothetical protein